MEKVYLIKNITEYGKLMSYCINNDVSVFRTYWDEREAGDRCFRIDWKEKRCYYACRKYWENEGYKVIEPVFVLDKFGNYQIDNQHRCLNCQHSFFSDCYLECKLRGIVNNVGCYQWVEK